MFTERTVGTDPSTAPRRPRWGQRTILHALPEGSLRRRLAGGAFWSVLGSGGSQASMLLTLVITARVLGASAFGELGMILLTVNLGATLATFGLEVTATKFVAEHRRADPARAGAFVGSVSTLVAGLAVASALALAVLAPVIASRAFHAPDLGGALRLAAPLMALQAVNAVQNGTLAGLEAFRSQALASSSRGLLILILAVIGARVAGMRGALVGYCVAAAAMAVVYRLLIWREAHRRGLRISQGWPGAEARALFRFSLPVLVSQLAFTPASWWSNALLVSRGTFAESGVFSAARNWQNAVLFFSTAVANLGLPVLSSLVPERKFGSYLRGLAANFALTAGLATLAAAPVALLSPWIMSMYGPAFAHRGAVLMWVSVSAWLIALNITVGHVIWSLNAARVGMVLALLRGSALVTFSYLLVARGAEGLALAWVLTGVFQTVSQLPVIAWLLRRRRAEWKAGGG